MERKIKNNNEFIPTVAVPPGETIRDYINALDMAQNELAERLGITPKHLSGIVNGKEPITYETSLKLERVIGPSAEFWINLETNYQLDKARIDEKKSIEDDYEILKEIPYNDMSKFGWIEKTNNNFEKVKNCRKYYGVASLSNITNTYSVAFRQSKTSNNISDYGVIAWLKKAEERGERIVTEKINRKKLESYIPTFKKLTLKDPKEFYPEMVKICANCGVALVLVESIPKTYINGATIWKGEKAILGLSVRGKKADIFWFTFFHELAHLIEHTRKEFHINLGKGAEEQADKLARNYLIDDEIYKQFVSKYNYSSVSVIREFSINNGVHPCILVGRLQHDKLIEYNYKYEKLRPSFEIVKH